jgi:predicted ATPase
MCRRLDGIPLAIELAAARIDLLGLRGLAAALDKRLHVLTHGRRTAPLRHRTLRGTIDWSFQLLSPRQRIVFRRLSVFHGSFDMEAACAVIGDAGISQNDLFNDIADLVAKSLLTVDMTGEAMVYQLMETVRAYAAEQLALSTEQPVIKHRHAEWCCAWTTSPVFRNTGAALRASRMEKIDELRSALDWCFAPDGNPTLGVKLTAVSADLWFQLSLLEELRRRTEHALQVLDEFPETDPTVEVRLRVML